MVLVQEVLNKVGTENGTGLQDSQVNTSSTTYLFCYIDFFIILKSNLELKKSEKLQTDQLLFYK